jgi:hypothetical protein
MTFDVTNVTQPRFLNHLKIVYPKGCALRSHTLADPHAGELALCVTATGFYAVNFTATLANMSAPLEKVWSVILQDGFGKQPQHVSLVRQTAGTTAALIHGRSGTWLYDVSNASIPPVDLDRDHRFFQYAGSAAIAADPQGNAGVIFVSKDRTNYMIVLDFSMNATGPLSATLPTGGLGIYDKFERFDIDGARNLLFATLNDPTGTRSVVFNVSHATAPLRLGAISGTDGAFFSANSSQFLSQTTSGSAKLYALPLPANISSVAYTDRMLALSNGYVVASDVLVDLTGKQIRIFSTSAFGAGDPADIRMPLLSETPVSTYGLAVDSSRAPAELWIASGGDIYNATDTAKPTLAGSVTLSTSENAEVFLHKDGERLLFVTTDDGVLSTARTPAVLHCEARGQSARVNSTSHSFPPDRLCLSGRTAD